MAYAKHPFITHEQLDLQNVGIITKPDSREATSFASEIATWLGKRKCTVTFNEIDKDISMLIVLGGDGTILHIAEQAAEYSIPILGINLGSLGFLTELQKEDTFKTLEGILCSSVIIENRMMIRARILTQNDACEYRFALNEVVITKNALDRLLHLSTEVGGNLLANYKADGLIFSTPTGSTAYNLSAGGPLVSPGLSTILVTPICPFMLSSRPMILPAHNVIQTTFKARESHETAQVIVDGERLWKMQDTDVLEIEPASHPLKLIVSENHDYFSILRNKLHWGE